MICKSCGATITKTDRCCPYCGTDIFEKSKEEHDSIIRNIKQEENQIRQLPKKIANQTTKYLIIAAVIFVAIGIIAAGIAYGVRTLSVKVKYNQELELAQQLEAYYQDGDYAKISEMMNGVSSSNRALAKYENVSFLYNKFNYATGRFEEDLDFARKLNRADTIQSLNYFFIILQRCDDLEQKGFVYEEEDVVLEYRNCVFCYMEEEMQLTEEEISSFYERYMDTVEEYDRDSNYTYSMREADQNAINADAAELIYHRLIEE